MHGLDVIAKSALRLQIGDIVDYNNHIAVVMRCEKFETRLGYYLIYFLINGNIVQHIAYFTETFDIKC